MKHGTMIRSGALTLGLVVAGAGAAWADIGIAKCKDGTTGQGPSTGAAAYCASHGGLESWTALLAGHPPKGTKVYGPKKKKAGASY